MIVLMIVCPVLLCFTVKLLNPLNFVIEIYKYDCAFWADFSIVKSKVINKAIQDIGMGRYNWELFVLCGFGWFADKYAFLLIAL